MAGRRVTDQQVLEACIQKAIEGGWKLTGWETASDMARWHDEHGYDIAGLIFNHNFAKALFGEEINDEEYRYTSYEIPMWQYHLQQMVISPNPIDYLRTWLEGEV